MASTSTDHAANLPQSGLPPSTSSTTSKPHIILTQGQTKTIDDVNIKSYTVGSGDKHLYIFVGLPGMGGKGEQIMKLLGTNYSLTDRKQKYVHSQNQIIKDYQDLTQQIINKPGFKFQYITTKKDPLYILKQVAKKIGNGTTPIIVDTVDPKDIKTIIELALKETGYTVHVVEYDGKAVLSDQTKLKGYNAKLDQLGTKLGKTFHKPKKDQKVPQIFQQDLKVLLQNGTISLQQKQLQQLQKLIKGSKAKVQAKVVTTKQPIGGGGFFSMFGKSPNSTSTPSTASSKSIFSSPSTSNSTPQQKQLLQFTNILEDLKVITDGEQLLSKFKQKVKAQKRKQFIKFVQNSSVEEKEKQKYKQLQKKALQSSLTNSTANAGGGGGNGANLTPSQKQTFTNILQQALTQTLKQKKQSKLKQKITTQQQKQKFIQFVKAKQSQTGVEDGQKKKYTQILALLTPTSGEGEGEGLGGGVGGGVGGGPETTSPTQQHKFADILQTFKQNSTTQQQLKQLIKGKNFSQQQFKQFIKFVKTESTKNVGDEQKKMKYDKILAFLTHPGQGSGQGSGQTTSSATNPKYPTPRPSFLEDIKQKKFELHPTPVPNKPIHKNITPYGQVDKNTPLGKVLSKKVKQGQQVKQEQQKDDDWK